MKRANHVIEPNATVCPHFIALAGDDFVDADNNLNSLIEQLVADKSDQDVAIWDSLDTLVAIVLSDGTVHRFPHRSAPERDACERPAVQSGR